MKLRSDFITQEIDGTMFLVPVGAESFNGIVRGNKTLGFIVNCLKEETTEAEIIDAMCGKYDAPRSLISEDVKTCLDKLREIGALEE